MRDEDMDLCGLPEGCLSEILSLTSPQDACRLSILSTVFRSAAESDAVWEKFLPSDYQSIIARSDDGSSSSTTVFSLKKHLYLHLCDSPLLIDQGKKMFSLVKSSGKKCYMIAARDLAISWGDDPRYWAWVSHLDSRFAEVAELQLVWWLEIRGKINTCMLSPRTNYAAYLVFKLKPYAYLGNDLAEASVQIIGEEDETSVRKVYLSKRTWGRSRTHPYDAYLLEPQRWTHPYHSYMYEPERGGGYPEERGDGWLEIELGEYFNHGGHDQELEMSLVETKGVNSKNGLIVQGIEIRPKEQTSYSDMLQQTIKDLQNEVQVCQETESPI